MLESKRKWVTFCTTTSLLMSCQSIRANTTVTAPQIEKISKSKTLVNETELLFRIERFKERLSIDVVTTGCTKADDFMLSTKLIKKNSYDIRVVRRALDNCRAVPRLTTIELKIPTFLLDTKNLIHIRNPLAYFNTEQQSMSKPR